MDTKSASIAKKIVVAVMPVLLFSPLHEEKVCLSCSSGSYFENRALLPIQYRYKGQGECGGDNNVCRQTMYTSL